MQVKSNAMRRIAAVYGLGVWLNLVILIIINSMLLAAPSCLDM